MQDRDDLRGLAKVMGSMRAISTLFVVINIYWLRYQSLREWGINIGVVDRILLNSQCTAGLLSNILYIKLSSVIFLAPSCLGTKRAKEEKATWNKIYVFLTIDPILFFLNWWLLALLLPLVANTGLCIFTMTVGYLSLLVAGVWISHPLKSNLMDDMFSLENENFIQETRLIENEYSINLLTWLYYKEKWSDGRINAVSPFRVSMVLETPGSGKSYAIVSNYIKQQVEKGFAVYIYDYKFPDPSEIAYNHLISRLDGYKVKPKFYIINFDDPCRSHRCSPMNLAFMTDISDAYETSYTIMLNSNRSWITRQRGFFVESPIILLASIIWFLKIYQGGKYCIFPYAIEFLDKKYAGTFIILASYLELENYLSPLMGTWESDAQDQLQRRLASAKIPLSRMISPTLYRVMTGDDFSLGINSPEEPKVLVVGNNPDR